ncbi:MAG: nucleoside triphosphate pyrophosphatase [Chlamydiota bacterium]
MHIILGSQSPRRQEILSFFKKPFTVCSSGFDESTVIFDGSAINYVETQAKEKALALKSHSEKAIVLTADTTVSFNNKLFQKPQDQQEAFLFLKELSGQTHQVYTGICILYQDTLLLDTEMTKVTFHSLTDIQIHQYINKIDTLDKAGGYAIQGSGSLIVSKIEGCYYNVMGLPVNTLCRLLKKIGMNLWE